MNTQSTIQGDVIPAQPRKTMTEGAQIMKEALGERVGELRDSSKGVLNRGKERLQQWENNMEDKVREHPMRSVLIAAGVGAAVGLVLGVVLAKR